MNVFPEINLIPPLKFTPVYKERPWGGTLISELLRRDVPQEVSIGESWELSDRPEADTPVAEGVLAGVTLSQLVAHYGQAFIGSKSDITDRFPLLIKLIDAGERLSLQVHPDEEFCRENGGTAEPKTEMWYVIASRRGAKILAGLSRMATKLQLQEMISSPEVESLLQSHYSIPGDAFFIPAGMLHAIGGGNLLLEIQQNSDTTYRLSDWGRIGKDGKARELHLEDGMLATDFYNRSSPRIPGVTGEARFNRKFSLVNECQYFNVSELHLVSDWHDNTTDDCSFHLLTAVNGRVAVSGGEGRSAEIGIGETVLLAAGFGDYSIRPLEDGETTVLKTTL